MQTHQSRKMLISGLFVSTALVAGVLHPQHALAAGTQKQVVQIFIDSLKAAGAKGVEQEEITGDDAKFTLSGVEIDDGNEDDSISIDEITFIGAKPSADGGITADEIDINGIDTSVGKGSTTVESLKLLGVISPPPAKLQSPAPGQSRFDRLEATNFSGGDETTTVKLSYLLLTTADYEDGVPHKGTMELKGLIVPIKADDPQMADVIALGYKEFNLDASVKGSWDPKSGRAVLDWLNINAKDAGAVSFSAAIGGVTPDVVKQLSASKGDASQALGILQGLTIESASLKIENNSLYERTLDQQAKKQGTTKEALVHQGTALLPAVLTAVQNPAFEKKVVDAVTAFVASPKTLTLKIAPAQPVPVAQVIGVASAAPQTLPDVLGADVSANK